MEEQKIIEMLFARSEPALSELDHSYGRLAESIMGHILNNEEDIKECVNDTWLAVWNTIPPQRPDSLLNYVCRIEKIRRFIVTEMNIGRKGLLSSLRWTSCQNACRGIHLMNSIICRRLFAS